MHFLKKWDYFRTPIPIKLKTQTSIQEKAGRGTKGNETPVQEKVPKPKPRVKNATVKYDSDDEKEVEKLKELLKSKPELCKELEGILKNNSSCKFIM